MPLRDRHILLVDDELGIQRIFARALANYGIVTDCAADATAAMAQLTSNNYDVVVSDVNLPGCNGIELVRMLRENMNHTPVILMTGRPSEEGRRSALQCGAFCYLIKPIMPSELRQVIKTALGLTSSGR